MLVDQTTERIIVPLNINLEKECKGRLELANSLFLLLFSRYMRI